MTRPLITILNPARPRLCAALLCAALALGSASLSPQDAQAQDDDWSVQGGSDRTQEIVRRYKQLLERSPVEGLALRKLIETVGSAKGLDRLIEEYRKKSEEDPDRVAYHLILGHLLKARNDYEGAEAAYSAAIERAPDDATAYIGRGQARMALQRDKESTADFERALELERDRTKKQDILRKLADLAFNQRDWERAQAYYDQLVELDRNNEFLRMEYAQVLLKYKRYDKALEQYEALLRIAGGDTKARATTLRDMGDLFEKMGDDERALATYDKAMSSIREGNWLHREIEARIANLYRRSDRLPEYLAERSKRWRNPSYDQAMILAGIHEELGDEERAFDLYKKASAKNRRSPDPRIKIIQILQRRGDSKGVVQGYKDLIRTSPSNARYRFDLAKLFFRNGDRKQAMRTLDEIARRFRRDEEIMVALADTYMRLDAADEALAVYKKLVRDDPKNDTFLIGLGEYHYQNGEVERAVEIWERLLSSRLSKAEAHAQLGLVFIEHNMVARGIEHYERAVEIAPEEREFQRGLALAYESGRRWDQAVALWTAIMSDDQTPDLLIGEARSRIIDVYRRQNRLRTMMREFRDRFDHKPPDVQAGYFLAESYSKLGEYDRAERVWKAIIDADGVTDKNDLQALMALEKIYTQRAEHDRAIEVLQKLAELRPARSKEYFQRIAELSLKNYEDAQAVEYAKLALDKNPDDAQAHARLGDVYARMQRYDEAIGQLREAIDLDPRAFDIHLALADLLMERGQEQEAFELYRLVASKSLDEAQVMLATRRAMGLADTTDKLELLEADLAPLVFRTPPLPVYRHVALEIYARLLGPLIARRDFGADLDELERGRLETVSARAYPVLLDALQSDQLAQRHMGIRMLADLGVERASGALGALIEDPEEPLRMQAIAAAARIGHEGASGALVGALDDEHATIREMAAWALGATGGKLAISRLIRVLEEGQNNRQRALAALSLGRLGTPQAMEAIARSLAQSERQGWGDELALASVTALGYSPRPDTAQTLTTILTSSGSSAGEASSWSLAQIGTEEALEALLNASWSEQERTRDRARRGLAWWIKASAEQRTERLEEDLALEASLVDAKRQVFDIKELFSNIQERASFAPLVDMSPILRDHQPTLQRVIAQKLSTGSDAERALVLQDLNATQGLGAALRDGSKSTRALMVALTPSLREYARASNEALSKPAISLLGRMADPADRALIIAAARAGQPGRLDALGALGHVAQSGDERALEILIEATRDDSSRVRATACSALGVARAPNAQAIEALATRLGDDAFLSVRVEAAHALGASTKKAAQQPLIKTLNTPTTPRALRIATLRALATLGATDALKPWRDHHDPLVREAARVAKTAPTASVAPR